jgi:hypothetical protein
LETKRLTKERLTDLINQKLLGEEDFEKGWVVFKQYQTKYLSKEEVVNIFSLCQMIDGEKEREKVFKAYRRLEKRNGNLKKFELMELINSLSGFDFFKSSLDKKSRGFRFIPKNRLILILGLVKLSKKGGDKSANRRV